MRARSWVIVALAWGLTATSPAAETSQNTQADPKKPRAERKKRAPAPVVLPGGSGETAAERSARLKRECKGRPNAGACTGYTD
jgi:hypothetical protein